MDKKITPQTLGRGVYAKGVCLKDPSISTILDDGVLSMPWCPETIVAGERYQGSQHP